MTRDQRRGDFTLNMSKNPGGNYLKKKESVELHRGSASGSCCATKMGRLEYTRRGFRQNRTKVKRIGDSYEGEKIFHKTIRKEVRKKEIFEEITPERE